MDDGTDGDGEPVREHLEPADAFALLGDETRLEIVRTLAEWSTGEPPTFAELRRTVGVSDPGRFNYHLGRLRGHFLVKDGESYRTTYAGEKVYEALATGTFTERVDERSGPAGHDCPLCGAAMEARYADGSLSMSCPTHDEVVRVTLPPRAAAGRDLSGLVRLADLEARRTHNHLTEGVCPRCWATLSEPIYTAELPDTWAAADEDDAGSESSPGVLVRFDCENCGTSLGSSTELFLSMTADGVAFFADHGVDALERGVLSLPSEFDHSESRLRRDESGEVVGATVAATLDGETLTAELDERAGLVCASRGPAD
jgi:DNA-binding transcriptional ArsR family regulator